MSSDPTARGRRRSARGVQTNVRSTKHRYGHVHDASAPLQQRASRTNCFNVSQRHPAVRVMRGDSAQMSVLRVSLPLGDCFRPRASGAVLRRSLPLSSSSVGRFLHLPLPPPLRLFPHPPPLLLVLRVFPSLVRLGRVPRLLVGPLRLPRQPQPLCREQGSSRATRFHTFTPRGNSGERLRSSTSPSARVHRLSR